MTARSLGERFYRRATSIYRGARTSIYWRATSIIGGAPHIYCVVPRQNIDAIDEIDAINAINAINAITSIYKRVYLYKRLSRSRYTSRKSKIVPNTPDLRTACQINKSTARINTTRVRRLPGAAQTHAKKRQKFQCNPSISVFSCFFQLISMHMLNIQIFFMMYNRC